MANDDIEDHKIEIPLNNVEKDAKQPKDNQIKDDEQFGDATHEDASSDTVMPDVNEGQDIKDHSGNKNNSSTSDTEEKVYNDYSRKAFAGPENVKDSGSLLFESNVDEHPETANNPDDK